MYRTYRGLGTCLSSVTLPLRCPSSVPQYWNAYDDGSDYDYDYPPERGAKHDQGPRGPSPGERPRPAPGSDRWASRRDWDYYGVCLLSRAMHQAGGTAEPYTLLPDRPPATCPATPPARTKGHTHTHGPRNTQRPASMRTAAKPMACPEAAPSDTLGKGARSEVRSQQDCMTGA